MQVRHKSNIVVFNAFLHVVEPGARMEDSPAVRKILNNGTYSLVQVNLLQGWFVCAREEEWPAGFKHLRSFKVEKWDWVIWNSAGICRVINHDEFLKHYTDLTGG